MENFFKGSRKQNLEGCDNQIIPQPLYSVFCNSVYSVYLNVKYEIDTTIQ